MFYYSYHVISINFKKYNWDKASGELILALTSPDSFLKHHGEDLLIDIINTKLNWRWWYSNHVKQVIIHQFCGIYHMPKNHHLICYHFLIFAKKKKIKKYIHLHECLQKWWEYLNLMTRCHKIFQNLQDNGNTFNEMYGVFEFIDNKWSSNLGWPYYYICIE